MKGRDLLNSKGIKCEIKRVSKNKSLSGCGYGLLIYEKEELAEELMKKYKIKILEKKVWEAN